VLAVPERQALEAMTRDEKTAHRVVGALQNRQARLEERRDSLREDGEVEGRRVQEVMFPPFEVICG
jgi:hypothetical protein